MPRLSPFVFAVVLVVAVPWCASPVAAGVTSVGANLGVSMLFPEHGDGLLVASVPGTAGQGFLPAFMPGIRIAVTDDSGANTFLLDPSFYLLSVSNSSFASAAGLIGYQRQFSPASPSSAFFNVEVGGMLQSYESSTETNGMFGVGLGVRHRLAHGHGASRTEIRVDRIDTEFEGITAVSLRVGFDLDTK